MATVRVRPSWPRPQTADASTGRIPVSLETIVIIVVIILIVLFVLGYFGRGRRP